MLRSLKSLKYTLSSVPRSLLQPTQFVSSRSFSTPAKNKAADLATVVAATGLDGRFRKKFVKNFDKKIVFVGFGSIGQGTLPLIFRHIDCKPSQVSVITGDERGREEAEALQVKFTVNPLKKDNFKAVLDEVIGEGDFLVNVSVDVSSTALIEYCQSKGAFYLDTCTEPWPGGYTDPSLSPSQRSNYALRESALALRKKYKAGPAAILSHGANPGMVSHLTKVALLQIAKDTGVSVPAPKSRADWAGLAEQLSINVIHIAERDTQVSQVPKEVDEFVNTWSIDGFVSEGAQPAELGWGTHEKGLPPDGKSHDFGSQAAIYLMRPGASTRVRSWTPQEGPYHGFLITHAESISISDYFTTFDKNGKAKFRPTCHYAYHPCDDAVKSIHEFAGKNWNLQSRQRLLMDEIIRGTDELGVLLMGHKKGAYWYGSQLTIEEARRVAPYNNATSLQVTAAVLGGVIYGLKHPKAGIVEPDEMDFQELMEIMTPYLGNLHGEYSDWTPLHDRERLFPEDVDKQSPWQFKNFRVN